MTTSVLIRFAWTVAATVATAGAILFAASTGPAAACYIGTAACMFTAFHACRLIVR